MATTITTYTIPAGFTNPDVLDKLEEVFAALGYCSPTVSGLVLGLQGTLGGGSGTTMASTQYYDVRPISTSGNGTGASFDVIRSSGGVITSVQTNRPGQGYVTGDTVVLSAADIGGSANGATNLTISLNATTTSYGSPSTYFAKDLAASNPWGVIKMPMDVTKEYGYTYRGFTIINGLLYTSVGSSFQPATTDNTSNLGWGARSSYRGNAYLDTIGSNSSSANQPFYSAYYQQSPGSSIYSSNAFDLDIITYTSQLDPDFTVIQFRQPTLSSTTLANNTFATFSLNKYNTPLWDLDYVFQGGVLTFFPVFSSVPSLQLNYIANGFFDVSTMKRMAEYGFSRRQQYTPPFTDSYYSSLGTTTSNNQSAMRTYFRNSVDDKGLGSGPTSLISPAADFHAAIKGIPLSNKVSPCPYYLPEEFVLIDFITPGPQNIQPGDTVTKSASEIYTIVTGGYYNDGANTWGMLFACRTT